MLSCRDISLKASDYLDGELSWWMRAKIRMHVLMCQHCRRYLVQLRLMIRALQLLGKRDTAARKSEEDVVSLLLEKHEDR